MCLEGRDRHESIVSLLRASYGAKEAFDRKDSFISRYVYRPVSFYLAVPFARLGFSASQVTLLSFVVALIGMGLLATGSQPTVLIGSLLCAVGALLDYVDGNIARLHGTTSHLGKFLDGMADTLVGAFTPLAVSFGLYLRPDRVLVNVRGQVDHRLILLVGALTSVAICLQALFVYRLRAARFEIQLAEGRAQTDQPTPAAPVGSLPKPLRSAYDSLRYGLRTEAYFMLAGIVLFAALDIMSVYLAIRLAARSLDFATELARSLVQARHELDVHRAY